MCALAVASTLTKKACQDELTQSILPFWTKLNDLDNGGYYGRVSGKNIPVKDSPKGVTMHAHLLWLFSAAYGRIKDQGYLNQAMRTYEYLVGHFLDEEFGGFLWEITYDGRVLHSEKWTYAQAATILGLTEYFKISDDRQALTLCIDTFHAIEAYTFDKKYNGYLEGLDRHWGASSDVNKSNNHTLKTLRTHLHLLEAYTNLYRIWPHAKVRDQLENLTKLIIRRFVVKSGHLGLNFDASWNLISRSVSFGHDIEASWLIQEAAMLLAKEDLILLTEKVANGLTTAALKGQDADGGFSDEKKEDVNTGGHKHWWSQAEALVGLVSAWKLTSDDFYFHKAQKTWTFINNYLIDEQNGEWYPEVGPDHKPILTEDKAGTTKAGYHNGRAMMEMMDRLEFGDEA